MVEAFYGWISVTFAVVERLVCLFFPDEMGYSVG